MAHHFSIGHDLKAMTDGLDTLYGQVPAYVSEYLGTNYRAGKSYFIGSNWLDAENDKQRAYYPRMIDKNLDGVAAVANAIHAKMRTLGGQLGRCLDIKKLPKQLREAITSYENGVKAYQALVEQHSGITDKKNMTEEEIAQKLNYQNVPTMDMQLLLTEIYKNVRTIHDEFRSLEILPIKIKSKETQIANVPKLHPDLEHSNLGITLLLMKYTAQGAADRNYYPAVQDYMIGAGFQETVIGDTFIAAVQTLLISSDIGRKDLPSANIRNSELHEVIIANQDQLRAFAFLLECVPGSKTEIESWPSKLEYQIKNAPKKQGRTTAELRGQAGKSVQKFFDMVHEDTDNIALLDSFKSPQEVAVYLYAAAESFRPTSGAQQDTKKAVLAFAEILSQQKTKEQANVIAQFDLRDVRKWNEGALPKMPRAEGKSILGQIEKLKNTAQSRTKTSIVHALELSLQYLNNPALDLGQAAGINTLLR